MTRRVIINSGAASPLRISVAGVDAATAEFNALIFDGNQSPLRLWGTGYVTVEGMSQNEYYGGQNVRELSAGAVVATPPGTTPVFMTMWRNSADSQGRLWSPSFQNGGYNNAGSSGIGGGGGAICSGQFIGVSFSYALSVSGDPTIRPAPNYTNYCVFKNYQ